MIQMQKRYDEQELRLSYFPKDRIPFWSSQTSASEDVKVFKDYHDGKITLGVAKERIARNNYLYTITDEQFFGEYHNLGWDNFY